MVAFTLSGDPLRNVGGMLVSSYKSAQTAIAKFAVDNENATGYIRLQMRLRFLKNALIWVLTRVDKGNERDYKEGRHEGWFTRAHRLGEGIGVPLAYAGICGYGTADLGSLC